MSTLVANKPLLSKESEESFPHNNQLFKPLVINQRIVRHSESDITTTSTTLPISSVNNDSNIPLIYPQFQLGVIPSLNNKRPINTAFIYQNTNSLYIKRIIFSLSFTRIFPTFRFTFI